MWWDEVEAKARYYKKAVNYTPWKQKVIPLLKFLLFKCIRTDCKHKQKPLVGN